jgi:hypothetical protein
VKNRFETTTRGQNARVVPVGEPGIGKTALCDHSEQQTMTHT